MMKTNKKAQVNQAFIFIFMLIIIATITIVAFKLMKPATQAACEGQISSMTSNLKKLSNSYSDFGTVKFAKINVPCDYEKICFISTDASPPSPPSSSEYFVIKQYLELSGSERDKNVFLIKDGKAEAIALIPEINIDSTNDVVCVSNVGNSFPIKFEGKGKYALVSYGVNE